MGDSMFSFAIVAYNNYKYIYEAIDSVLIQSYPNIELIISNDGSKDFNEEAVRKYILQYQKGNIANLIVNNNLENIGTVANVEYCRRIANGDYIMYMAADDSLYDDKVIERFVNEFNRLGNVALCITSKVAMCGYSLEDVISTYPDDSIIEVIKQYTPQQLFSRMCHTFTIPTTSTCYRKELYDVVGPYDSRYFIIEDAPLYLKMSRLGVKIYWLDIISARHRDGGISHGNQMKLTESFRKYRFDEILIYKNEILPYQHLMSRNDQKRMLNKWHYLDYAYWNDFENRNLKNIKTWKHLARSVRFLIKELIKRVFLNDRLLMHLVSLSVFTMSFKFIINYFNFGPSVKITIENISSVMLVFVSLLLLIIYIIKILYKIKKWGGF